MKVVKQFLLLVCVTTWVCRLGLPAAEPTCAEPSKVSLTPDEALLMRLLNAEREERGERPLLLDPVLVEVARQHSADMARRGYFSHVEPPPTRRTPLDRYAAALGRRPRTVIGENIGQADQPIMGMIHERMIASPQHKANILDPEYAGLGVGIYALDGGRVWVTEMFRGEMPEER